MAAGRYIPYSTQSAALRSARPSKPTDNSHFPSAPLLPNHRPPQGTRDPTRVLSDLIQSHFKSPWTATTRSEPRGGNIPQKMFHTPPVQNLPPRCPSPARKRGKPVPMASTRRRKKKYSRQWHRSRRRSPSPRPTVRSPTPRKSSSDDSEVTESSESLLTPLTGKTLSPARSYEMHGKVRPATTTHHKKGNMQLPTASYHPRMFLPERTAAMLSSPSASPKYKLPVHTLDQPQYQQATSATARFILDGNPACEERDHLANFEPAMLPSHTAAPMPLRAASGVGAHLSSGLSEEEEVRRYHHVCGQHEREPFSAAHPANKYSCNAGHSRGARIGLARQCDDSVPRVTREARANRHKASVAKTGRGQMEKDALTSSSTTRFGTSSSELTGESTGSGRTTRRASLVLCLGAAALMSFWAFYAVTDAVMSGRDVISNNPDPITVQPEEESVRGLTTSLTPYQNGPISIIPKLLSVTATSLQYHSTNRQENNETGSNATSAEDFT